MKKEVFIMHDFKALCRQAHTLVIFKSLHEVPVFEKLLDTLAVCESDSDQAIEKYSDFVAELFAYSDNLTEYMLKLVLENENLFMLKKGEGKVRFWRNVLQTSLPLSRSFHRYQVTR